MWEQSFSVDMRCTPEEVWTAWTDVSNWNRWDGGVVHSSLDGPFESGSRGVLKPASGPTSNWFLVDVQRHQRFTNEARLPLGRLQFVHVMTPIQGDSVRVTHTIRLSGPLTFLFQRVIGKPAAADIPAALTKLKSMVEARRQSPDR